jgi:DnaJ family protein B protein 4
MKRNYYKILELEYGCSGEEIKKSFRKLSLKYHPDKNKECNSDKFVEISDAYETLSDPEKKTIYDNQFKMNNPLYNDLCNDKTSGLNSLFSDLFGNMNIKSGHIFNQLSKPPPIINSLEIDIETIYKAQNIPIEIERWIMSGDKKSIEKERIYVDIPEGVDENELIIIREKGNINELGISGDLKIFIRINNNSCLFKRNGLDLEMCKVISLRESLCGFSFEIEHINGKKYAIKNEMRKIIYPGFKKVINNLGIKRGNSSGNLIIKFEIMFPESINENLIDKINRILEMNDK